MAKEKETLVITGSQYGITEDMKGKNVIAKLSAIGLASSQTAAAYSPTVNGERVGFEDMIAETSLAAGSVADNKLGRIETMLVSQMVALDVMFNNLAMRAYKAEYMDRMETYTKLALRCQAQARCAAEAIVMMKNPQPYIRQTNIAQGHQQVNNTYASTPSHTATVDESSAAGKPEIMQSKLLGVDNERMDTRTQSQTVGVDQVMEAVGTQHRRKDTRRQSTGG
jgi:hypothetical protein